MAADPASGEMAQALGAADETTPTGTQRLSVLARRRLTFAILVIVTIAFMAAWLAEILSADGLSILDALLLVMFLANAPWIVIGFWNALIGFAVLHFTRDPLQTVIPLANRARDDDPIFERTAIFMTVRNENPARAYARMIAIKASLDATGFGDRFDYFILSDSSRAKVIATEEKAIAAWKKEARNPDQLFYRHRKENTGFKAGNVRDFCERWGKNYEFMVPLDADSLMTGAAILRLARIMQANPRLGILQSLVVGMPSSSFFARIFQFGMRHSMRSYTAGSSWWHADCGPFWGHNAIVRIKPFTDHCKLPDLPGKPPFGGQILSHDQVEAVLMRRAGYEVRVLPEEGGSYEENPPTLLDFIQRDVRWCQGNMQYIKLLDLPGLFPTSWAQIALAIQMFIGSAGLVLFVALAALAAALLVADRAVSSALGARALRAVGRHVLHAQAHRRLRRHGPLRRPLRWSVEPDQGQRGRDFVHGPARADPVVQPCALHGRAAFGPQHFMGRPAARRLSRFLAGRARRPVAAHAVRLARAAVPRIRRARRDRLVPAVPDRIGAVDSLRGDHLLAGSRPPRHGREALRDPGGIRAAAGDRNGRRARETPPLIVHA